MTTDPDALPTLHPRTARRARLAALGLAAVAALGGLTGAGLYARRFLHERDARELFQHVRGNGVTPGRPLTDPEFARAVALCDSPSRPARVGAYTAAAESADTPARRAALAELAGRRLAAADPLDRQDGLVLVRVLGLTEFRERAVELQADPDPGVREQAAAAAGR